MGKRKILSVVGARPNFMKVAPLHRSLLAHGGFLSRIIHTGQHYDSTMSDVFIRQLDLPQPDIHLGIGSGTQAEQTGRVMIAFERVLEVESPNLVIVVGDVNSTLACALAAVKQGVAVGHVEAGLRSFDRTMPEEINRLVTDRIADWLFVTEQSGLDNLKAEGIPDRQVFFLGNLMIDSLVHAREQASHTTIREELGLDTGSYVLATIHRPANVDSADALSRVVDLLESISAQCTVVFPVHPRTRQRLQDFSLADRFHALERVRATEPLGYLEFLSLMDHAGAVLTDSGGIQEETTFLQVPCLTLRETTERPVTITAGTNELVPLDAKRVSTRVRELLATGRRQLSPPPLWDGQAAARIVAVLERIL